MGLRVLGLGIRIWGFKGLEGRVFGGVGGLGAVGIFKRLFRVHGFGWPLWDYDGLTGTM